MPDEDDLRDGDSGQVGIGGRDDGVQLSDGDGRPCVARALARPIEMRGVGLDDGDLETDEAKRRRVDTGEAELEHALRRLPEQLDDPRCRRSGQRRRQSCLWRL